MKEVKLDIGHWALVLSVRVASRREAEVLGIGKTLPLSSYSPPTTHQYPIIDTAAVDGYYQPTG